MKLICILAALAATAALASPAPAQDLGSFGQYEKIELTFPYISTPTFADIPGDYWAFDGIKACAAACIVTAYDDRTFRPEALRFLSS